MFRLRSQQKNESYIFAWKLPNNLEHLLQNPGLRNKLPIQTLVDANTKLNSNYGTDSQKYVEHIFLAIKNV